MEQYISKDALLAGIEKVIDEPAPLHDQQCSWEDGYYCGLYKAEGIIDTFEVKEVDLEKELDRYYGVYRDKNGLTYDITDKERCFDWKEDGIMVNQAKAAKHFFELGLKAQKGE